MDVDNFLDPDSLEVEMVCEPPKTYESGSWNCCCSEKDVLWEVTCDGWDPWVGEGFVMSIILADPVDKENGEDSCKRSNLEVDSSRVCA